MRVAATALLSLCAGCSGAVTECSALYAYGLAVTVIDEATGAPICTATVTASDGAYHETLRLEQLGAPDGGVECLYPGAGERAGTYDVAAQVDGRQKTVTGVAVSHDDCHVLTRQLRIGL
jgi:hypothetical protein